ncbi:MAG: quinol:cytochrome C oxidoreductase [Planctomycetota bacterium]|nr:quinol:cytochrome C oxidoreductase [Planctomycetota bacterium]
MMAHDATTSDRRLDDLGSRMFYIPGLIGLVSLVVSLLIGMIGGNWIAFGRSYLVAFMFILSMCLGALFFTAIHHATRAGWSTVLRRISETVASNLMWIWVLFLPIVACMLWTDLYRWRDPGTSEILLNKTPFLNVGVYCGLSFLFFGVWALLGRFYYNNSVAQDSSGDVSLTHRMQALAPLALLVYAFSQSYGVILWLMSLEPEWFSTMYPVGFFATSCCGFFSLQIVIMFLLQKAGKLKNEITIEHYQDAGKLLFAFGIVFWTYIGFSQYMLIYYANIPEETGWFLTRQIGSWGPFSLVLLAGHFVLPFLALVTKHTKRAKGVLVTIACGMLVMHYIDIYWLIKPIVPNHVFHEARTYSEVVQRVADENLTLGFGWTFLDLTSLVALVGIFMAGTFRKLQSASLIPEQDPRLGESLAFENY